ncbi:glycosyltransferase family 2 protein [Streptomyces sp. NPDC060243]|uniref:glycosyltransferase family 2 protein n=1 Tax=Streptomyces sp. NPDC060243 TaxID=3347081 RepID=UPI00365FF0A3
MGGSARGHVAGHGERRGVGGRPGGGAAPAGAGPLGAEALGARTAGGSAPEDVGARVRYAVVVPTIGRACLRDCLAALDASAGPAPEQVVVVDDRPGDPLPLDVPEVGGRPVTVLRSGGRGPAVARNTGFAVTGAPWVVFLDDDVRVGTEWAGLLAEDLAGAEPRTGGVQGVLRVPLPADRAPTDWERGTAGLEDAAWATADMAYRAEALREVAGFDERFPRAFREDADLALRIAGAGWELRRGRRRTSHPVRPADRWVSVRAQRGNADDALMVRLHGGDWWKRAAAPRGRLRRHVAVSGAALAAPLFALAGRRRAAVGAAAVWALGTAEFAWARLRPGPLDRTEVVTMLATSTVIPPLAVGHRLAGRVRHRAAGPWTGEVTA